ncbi:endopeptidase, partial [Bacillus cereus]
GLALKIETAGVAYSKDEWTELAENKEIFPIYSHVVTLVGDEDGYYSCGMQAFALPDVIIQGEIEPETAGDLLNDFNLYNIVEQPKLKDGDTIS